MDALKEYQTLFWIPMIFQTATKIDEQIGEMLDLIADFHEKEDKKTPAKHHSVLRGQRETKRRLQILGDVMDSEVVTTRVDVVLKSENTKYAILSVLKKHFLFKQMHDYELEDVIDSMQSGYASAGEVIIRQGDYGDVFYVLEEGSCTITINGEVVGEIDEACVFGDLALMYNSPRAATITATSDCILWSLDRVFFRQAMVTSSSNQIVQLSQFLSKIKLFESLGVQSLSQLARSLTKQTYDDGTYIIRQGEIGEQFYVIFKGQVRVTNTGDDGSEKFLLNLYAGMVFGERAIIKKEPRAANIVADGPVECYYLDSANFQLMLGEIVDKMNLMNEFRLLRSSTVFNGFRDYWLKKAMQLYTKQVMFENQRLICDSNTVLAVLDGKVEASDGAIFAAGSVIGDLENGADYSAGAITVISFEAVVAVLNRNLLLEQLAAQDRGEDEVEERISTEGLHVNQTSDNELANSILLAATQDPSLDLEMKRTSILRKATAQSRRDSTRGMGADSLQELELLEPLGQGTFGTVFLCRSKVNGRVMAMKCLDKQALVQSSQHLYVKRELNALQNFHHSFIAQYYGLILSPRKIIFLMEYVSGGELWSYLYEDGDQFPRRGQFGGLSLQATANYAAIIMLVLEHIHGHGFSYRDLKPENLLVADNGYLKLVDFGFAKPIPFYNKSRQVQYRTFTLCGTPEYMAPEVVLTQGHDRSADYWAFGVLIFELLCRHTPFEGRSQQRTFEKIVHSTKHLTFPSRFDPHCKSLVRRLLHHNPALRLGALQNGFDDIRSHAFFAMQNVDFDKLQSQEVPMEFVPVLRNPDSFFPCDSAEFDIAEELTVSSGLESDPFESILRGDCLDDFAVDVL